MKWLLNFFSRGFLIRVSLILQPLLRIYFRGNKFIDPIDGSRYRKFLTYGYGERLRPNALCPGTLSLERHRMLWLYLERETSLLKDELKVLHIAPEQVFYKIFKGWKTSTKGIGSLKDLPKNAQDYVRGLEKFIETKVASISTSPERKDTILIENPFSI